MKQNSLLQEGLIKKLTDDLEILKSNEETKDEEIQNLKEELENLKRNSRKRVPIEEIYKDLDTYFNSAQTTRKTSVETEYSESFAENAFELNIESQLAIYKLKFAEYYLKIQEFQEELFDQRNQNANLKEKVSLQNSIIDKLVKERDELSLKFQKNSKPKKNLFSKMKNLFRKSKTNEEIKTTEKI